MNAHLTEPQLYDLLSSEQDDGSAVAVTTHLAVCSLCQGELAFLRASIAGFRVAADSYSLEHTPLRSEAADLKSRRFLTVPQSFLAAGLASVLALSAITVSNLYWPSKDLRQANIQSVVQPVSDEALLQDVESDLSTSVPAPLQPLETSTSANEQSNIASNN